VEGGSVEKLLSRKELAALLGVPVNTVANWAAAGTGPKYARIGRHARYRVVDVEKWLDARAQERDAS
jgi:excisionase family DNA binding protein